MEQKPEVLNIASFLKSTTVVGPGIRDAIWTQGCSICCIGCANQSYWPHEQRVLLSVERLKRHFKSRIGKIDGISILGGEPTEQIEAVTALLREVKQLELTTVVFTGLLLEELQKGDRFFRLLKYTDLLIDGPFVKESADASLHWRGSTNQRLILLKNPWNVTNIENLYPDTNGEILISGNRVTLHGIGTQPVSDSFLHFSQQVANNKNFPRSEKK